MDKVETHRSLPLVSRIGGRQPAYCTGLGKALLAFQSEERLREVLPSVKYNQFTPNTITDAERLLAELAVVRTRGYALDNEEHEPGISCVAFPIFDLYGEPIDAISATSTTRELNGKIDAYVEAVQGAAQRISKAFGWRG